MHVVHPIQNSPRSERSEPGARSAPVSQYPVTHTSVCEADALRLWQKIKFASRRITSRASTDVLRLWQNFKTQNKFLKKCHRRKTSAAKTSVSATPIRSARTTGQIGCRRLTSVALLKFCQKTQATIKNRCLPEAGLYTPFLI